ncbi:GTP-binding protein [Mycoplasmatota bacterium]|nr:GTP-binding protein [Mycoplasmatota bacterium]
MFNEENMSIVIVGHVDHGKSTVIGRLLHDTNSLPEGKLDQVKETCKRNSKPFEYAFLLDALKDEQAQGITIDAARVFFNSDKRKYIIMDAPGHIEFLKNMVTGAARAEAALLVIDAQEGVMENSRRHGYLLSMLGIKQIVVIVNKMDLIDYDKEKYDIIVEEYEEFLSEIGVTASKFIPVSGFYGDNVASHSDNMSWYTDDNVLEALDNFENKSIEESAFRMPVQDVYKFTANGDDRRIVAGTIDSGQISIKDEIIFYPSRKKSRVNSIEYFNGDVRQSAYIGQAAGFTLEEQIYISRGEVACNIKELKPEISTRFKAKIFWLGEDDLVENYEYIIKIGTKKVTCKIEKIVSVLDASNLNNKIANRVKRHEVADIIIKTDKEVAFDLSENVSSTSRFVLIDNYEISGGGIIIESIDDGMSLLRKQREERDLNWYKSGVTSEEREKLYGHKPLTIIISGDKGSGRKSCARFIEKKLCMEDKKAYYLPFNNVVHGVGTDISKYKDEYTTKEHFRRLSEITNILNLAGVIVIVTIQSSVDDNYKYFFNGNTVELQIDDKDYEYYYKRVLEILDK